MRNANQATHEPSLKKRIKESDLNPPKTSNMRKINQVIDASLLSASAILFWFLRTCLLSGLPEVGSLGIVPLLHFPFPGLSVDLLAMLCNLLHCSLFQTRSIERKYTLYLQDLSTLTLLLIRLSWRLQGISTKKSAGVSFSSLLRNTISCSSISIAYLATLPIFSSS
nr:hypothetical protein [Tanacetum cinerariifolium]